MNRKYAQERNSNIRRLRGMLPLLINLIPNDVIEKIEVDDIKQLDIILNKIIIALNQVKKKQYTCERCNPIHGKITKNKKALMCDYCRCWQCDLYLVKKEK